MMEWSIKCLGAKGSERKKCRNIKSGRGAFFLVHLDSCTPCCLLLVCVCLCVCVCVQVRVCVCACMHAWHSVGLKVKSSSQMCTCQTKGISFDSAGHVSVRHTQPALHQLSDRCLNVSGLVVARCKHIEPLPVFYALERSY